MGRINSAYTTMKFVFTPAEMQAHDARILKEQQEKIKKGLLEFVANLDSLYAKDIRYFFAQLEKEVKDNVIPDKKKHFDHDENEFDRDFGQMD